MASVSTLRPGKGAEQIAGWSAAGGLLLAFGVVALTGRIVLDERVGAATKLGALGFSAAFMAPFVAALAAFLARDTEARRALWLASGVLAMILAGLTIFSGIGWLFGAAGAGLISAWWSAKGRGRVFGSARAIALTGWLILSLGGALWALWSRETPVCWSVTASGAGWAAATTPGDCVSDIVDDMEGVLALSGVAIGFAVAALIVARGRANGG